MVKWKDRSVIFTSIVIICALSVSYTTGDGDLPRLPKSVIPIHYDIHLVTDVHTGARPFTGHVKIQVHVRENTNTITLHSRGLDIQNVILKEYLSGTQVLVDKRADLEEDFLIVETVSRTLQPGEEFMLEIEYTGRISVDMVGFYRSQYYVEGENVPRYLAATQFQDRFARRAFPNFDEPEFKAVFRLSITHSANYFAISNMDGMVFNNPDGTRTTSFPDTPKMSSYLVAFVISDFASRSLNNGPSKVESRIYGRLSDSDKFELALTSTDLLLKALEQFCSFKYELPKLGHVAVPDFAAGAMENWGLILYKEYLLIVNEHSHPGEIFNMLRVTAHEIAHQFFGNIVTYQWWDRIYLNEGFAAYFEYKLVEMIHPDLMVPGFFNVRKLHNGLRRDSLQSTQPMTTNSSIPSEISYDKGGSVIRMFEYIVGGEIFRASLNRYLIDNSYQPVVTDDLMKAFEQTLSQNGISFPIDRAWKNWELQKGYPLLNVRYDATSRNFRITQSKYLSYGEDMEDDSSSWYIPLSFTTGNLPDFDNARFTDYFIDGMNEKIISTTGLQGFDGTQWFIFNIQQMGYYRVNYDESNWRRLIEILNSDNYHRIHVLNRAQLVDDALTLAFDGYISYDIALGIVSYLSRETEYFPWYPAVIHFDKVDFILKGTPLQSEFRRYVQLLLRRMYATYGLQNIHSDSIDEKLARELAIEWTCRTGDHNCYQYAFDQLKLGDIPKPLEVTLICNGLKGVNKQSEFVRIFRKFQSSSDQADRLRYIDGLLCSSDPEALGDLLENTLGAGIESFYRDHERSRIYSNIVARSSVGLRVLTDFIIKYYNQIPQVGGNVDSLLVSASTRVSSSGDKQLLLDTLDKLEADGRTLNADTRKNILRNIELNNEFVSGQRYQDILVFLNNYLGAIDLEESQLRLPKTSEPLFYQVQLDVRNAHTGQLPYTGEVTADILIKENTDRIMFHSKQQTINELVVTDRIGNEIKILSYSLQTAADSITIYFMDHLHAGTQIVVHIKYSTELLTGGSGFYRTQYTEGGVTKYLATTQFQPTGARYAFPHYDEPGYKTQIELSIRHDESFHAIANTLGMSINNGDGTVTTYFEKTPSMSSYLLAFVVSEFANISNADTKKPGDTLHRIWTKPDSISKAQYALENSEKVLKALEDYCYFEYALSKVDSAAIPNKGGAMENWGMVTYWETAMIYEVDYNDIPHNLKFSGVRVIAHELAHQFFGNAVTCEFWDQIWLNEGFATLMQYNLVDLVEPTWRMQAFMNTFTMINTAFVSDSRDTTRPMTNDVLTLSEISRAFDNVAYDKSGCVLRMFEKAVGENIFRRSLELYLKTKNYQPVISQDLVEAFETTMRLNNIFTFDFTRAFRTWENQAGYPLINVRYDIPSESFRITQQRFFEQKRENSNDNSSWYIPLNYATASNPNFEDITITSYFADGTNDRQILHRGFDASLWYVFNKQQFGYYRVNYDEHNWRALSNALNSNDYSKIHVLNRVQLIDDSMALAVGGYIEYETAYDILKYLTREDDFFPFYAAYRIIRPLISIYGWRNEILNKFIHHLTVNFYEKFKLTANNQIPIENVPDRYGREYAMLLACNSGNEECLNDSSLLLQQHIEGKQKIPNGLEQILCFGLKGVGKENEFVQLYQQMQLASTRVYQNILIIALGCSDNSELLKDYLETSLGSGSNNVNYTFEQRQLVFYSVLNSDSAIPVVLQFIEDFELEIMFNYDWTLENILTTVASAIKNEEDRILFLNFISSMGNLDAEIFERVSKIVLDNKAEQDILSNLRQLELMKSIIDEWEYGKNDAYYWILPKTSRPEYYKVDLDVRNIHTGRKDYSGNVMIDVLILESTNYIAFHSKQQVIHEVRVHERDTSEEIAVLRYQLIPSVDVILIFFESNLSASSRISVHIKYSTSLLTASYGFYQTSYVMDKETKYVGATQFEPVRARYALPVYDEPEYKTPFELTITHDQSVRAFANTMENITANEDGTLTTRFTPSPIMSAYLLAFAVGDFAYISNEAFLLTDRTLQRIIVRPDSLLKTKYALENSVAILKALEDYVGHKYELNKLDSIGIPLKLGAMENFGLITYRENALIYDENYNEIPIDQNYNGVEVIAHEIAHQFFGNAVTCKSWSYIWLNEGFAQLLQFILTDIVHPEWRAMEMINIYAFPAAFGTDAKITTRPMTANATTPSEISGLFDNIAYPKSASVIRMFLNAIGEDLFKKVLNYYIGKNNGTAVESKELLEAFETILGQNNFTDFNFEKAFKTWETQKGFPLITVNYNEERNTLIISQERFFEDKSVGVNDTTSFYIPLNIATASNPNFSNTKITHYFPDGARSLEISASDLHRDQWYILNKQQIGYYRVNYDEHNWRALINILNSNDYRLIHPVNRLQILDDAFALSEAGYLEDFEIAFKVMNYLAHEDDFFPWRMAFLRLYPLYEVFGYKNEMLNKYIHHLSKKFYNKYKLSTSNVIPYEIVPERFGRKFAYIFACTSRNEDCLQDANTLLKLYLERSQSIPKDLETIYCDGLKGIERTTEFVEVWKRMSLTEDPNFKNILINALGCADNTTLLRDYLESSLGSGVNNVNYTLEDRRNVFAAVLQGNSGITPVIEFIKKFESTILSTYQWTLEVLLTNVANTIKNNQDQNIFLQYMAAMSHISADLYRSNSQKIIENLKKQQTPPYNQQIEIITKYVRNLNDITTTTPTTVTSEATTTSDSSNSQPTISMSSTTTTDGASIKGTNLAILIFILLITFVMKP